MIRVVSTYEDAVAHYPSYRKMTTVVYVFGLKVYTHTKTSDAPNRLHANSRNR